MAGFTYWSLHPVVDKRFAATVGLRNVGAHICAGGFFNVPFSFLPPQWLQWGSNPQPPNNQVDILLLDHAATQIDNFQCRLRYLHSGPICAYISS